MIMIKKVEKCETVYDEECKKVPFHECKTVQVIKGVKMTRAMITSEIMCIMTEHCN